jgi:hypothetical protein
MKKYISILMMLLIFSNLAYSQYYDRGRPSDIEDEEIVTLSEVGFSLMAGAILAFVGYLLKQIKAIEGLGNLLIILGAILGGGSLLIFILQIVEMILTTVVSFAIKAALVIGIIIIAFWLLRSIYEWLTGNNK